MLCKRQELHEYNRLILELQGDPGRFHQYFRVSTAQFDTLTNMIVPEIAKLSTNWRRVDLTCRMTCSNTLVC